MSKLGFDEEGVSIVQSSHFKGTVELKLEQCDRERGGRIKESSHGSTAANESTGSKK